MVRPGDATEVPDASALSSVGGYPASGACEPFESADATRVQRKPTRDAQAAQLKIRRRPTASSLMIASVRRSKPTAFVDERRE
jgi:hypothetical protein